MFRIKSAQFDGRSRASAAAGPRTGRFYPRGLLRGLAGVFPENVVPFRCTGVENGHVDVDFNHPLAGKPLELTAVVGRIGTKADERGGTSHDWIDQVLEGPGVQAPLNDRPTDFFSDQPFERDDPAPDPVFYSRPRHVQHLDDTAIDIVRQIYARFVEDGMRVLDLMSSWQSHLPDGLARGNLTGLGLNEAEMKTNPLLTDYVVHDLNADSRLPFASKSFDAVVCTVSIEYLTRPRQVFQEVGRVLTPGGRFVVTFSNRWFPPKAIRIWKELHDYERMGLVMAYFTGSDLFEGLQTYTFRGLPRPTDDRHYPRFRGSDPVYAVWGTRKPVPNQASS